jgi:hypothetical protein
MKSSFEASPEVIYVDDVSLRTGTQILTVAGGC